MLESALNHLEVKFCTNIDQIERYAGFGTVKAIRKLNTVKSEDGKEEYPFYVVFKQPNKAKHKTALQIGFSILDFAKVIWKKCELDCSKKIILSPTLFSFICNRSGLIAS